MRPALKEKSAYYQRIIEIKREMEGDYNLLQEAGLEESFRREILADLRELEQEQKSLEQKLEHLKSLSQPASKTAENLIVEIRAGTGGEEAALFAASLYKMYSRYAESKGWPITLLHINQTDLRGIKEVFFSIKSAEAFELLHFESGTHRVQRIPATEKNGRVHTSTATVAVMAEPTATELVIDSKDLRIDTYHSSGKGGQHVNVTDSAIRITHLPTGIVETCQTERSQHKNKAAAMRMLRTKLYDKQFQDQMDREQKTRKGMIGRARRSDKIRTYNFPQDRISDHRFKKTWHNLQNALNGDIDEILQTAQSKLGAASADNK